MVLSPAQQGIFQPGHKSSIPLPEASSKTQLFPTGSAKLGDVTTSMKNYFTISLYQKLGSESREER